MDVFVLLVCEVRSKISSYDNYEYERTGLMRSTDRKLMNFTILVYKHIGCDVLL